MAVVQIEYKRADTMVLHRGSSRIAKSAPSPAGSGVNCRRKPVLPAPTSGTGCPLIT